MVKAVASRCGPARLVACGVLIFLLGAQAKAQINVLNATTTNTTSTTFHETDTTVQLPDFNTVTHVTSPSSGNKMVNGGDVLHIEWTIDHPIGDPKVQAALSAALKVMNAEKPPFPQGATLHKGGAQTAGGSTSVVGVPSHLVGTTNIGTNTTVSNTVDVGPGTLLYGPNMSQSYFIAAGNANINTNTAYESFFLKNFQAGTVTTITDGSVTTEVLQRTLVLDLNAVYSTMFSGIPVAQAQRSSLLSAHNAIGDVNGRIFRAMSGAGYPGTPQGDGTINADTSVFLSGSAGWLHQDGGDSVAGVHDAHESISAGVEWRVAPDWRVGVAASYVHSDTDFSDDLGKQHIDGGALSAYVTWRKDPWYVDLLCSAGLFNDTTNRNTLYAGNANGSADDWSHLVSLNAGYVMKLNEVMSTGPYASLTYGHGNLSGYDEHGGGSAALTYGAQSFDSLVSSVGWQANWRLLRPWGAITPLVRLGWERENLGDTGSVSATLLRSPFSIEGFGRFGGFGVNTTRESARYDALNVGAGVSFEVGERWTMILDAAETTDFGPRNDFSIALRAEHRF